jgi:hypothetical protein
VVVAKALAALEAAGIAPARRPVAQELYTVEDCAGE